MAHPAGKPQLSPSVWYVAQWLRLFTIGGGVAFLLVYVVELLTMFATSAEVRALEETSYLFYTAGRDMGAHAIGRDEEHLFDLGAWLFDINKIVKYSLIALFTYFVARILLNRGNVNGILDSDLDQLQELDRVRPSSLKVTTLGALLITLLVGGKAISPLNYGNTSLWHALSHLDFALISYRLVFVVFLWGFLTFLLCVAQLLIRVPSFNRNRDQRTKKIRIGQFGGRGTLKSHLMAMLLGWALLVLWSWHEYLGPAGRALFGRGFIEGGLAFCFVLMLLAILDNVDKKQPQQDEDMSLRENGSPPGEGGGSATAWRHVLMRARVLPWIAFSFFLLPMAGAFASSLRYVSIWQLLSKNPTVPAEHAALLESERLEAYLERIREDAHLEESGLPQTRTLLELDMRRWRDAIGPPWETSTELGTDDASEVSTP